MPDVTANGVRLHVQRLSTPGMRDDAPAVVFLHGLVMDNLSSFYYTLACPAAAAGARVVLYDLRGHGRSERTPTGYRVTDSVADLAALLDELAITGPVHLVGNSYGGTVALSFAVAYPRRVASLVLIEAHFAIEGWGEQMAGTLSMIAFGLQEGDLRTWQARHGRKLGRMAAGADDIINNTSLVDDLLAVEPIPVARLAALSCPVRAVYGEESDVLGHARLLAEHIPDFTLTVLPGCTHSVLMEATGFLREALVGWLGAAPVAP
jgi:pimeloyl-ACP methyl ester carboxylesterase